MKVSDYALKSFQALKEKSVIECYPEIISKCEEMVNENIEVSYVGVKNTNVIPLDYLNHIEKQGFLVHTRDVSSERGRAVDIDLANPITGRFMSGSSSGTALNVFKGINDIGIGTDGGGSVLAPALNLNLYGFISPLICHDALSQYSKKSTDNIEFRPSIGYIARDLSIITKITELSLELGLSKNLKVRVTKPINAHHEHLYSDDLKKYETVQLSYNSVSRENLMNDLLAIDFDREILISFEGPVDLIEYGDSLMGHYSSDDKKRQMLGHKYYLTVANMMGLSALVIPSSSLSSGILLMCKSDGAHIRKMFEVAKEIPFERSRLELKYFSLENY